MTVEEVISVGPLDNRLGALLTVSEMAIFSARWGAVEITLAGRDNFGTVVTLALILIPRRAPLRHRFVPHCPCLLHLTERNADSIGGAPSDMTIALSLFRLDLKCKIVRNSDRACDLQTGTCLR